MKKGILLLLALFLLLAATAAADDGEIETAVEADWMYPGSDETVMLLSEEAGWQDRMDEICDILRTAAETRTEADLRSFGIPAGMTESLVTECLNRMPELYYLDKSYTYYRDASGIVTRIILKYIEGLGPEDNAVLEEAVQEALSCVSPGMDDVQKALALHEWLIERTRYDRSNPLPRTVFSAYGALVNGSAVCEGYTRAYQLLLQRCGIPSVIITSESMKHAWNAVQIGDKWYHVDTTWDDGDREDNTQHKYFLCSDSVFQALEHHDWNASVICDDDGFGTAFWRGTRGTMRFPDGDTVWYLRAVYDQMNYRMHISLMRRDWAPGAEREAASADDLWYVWDGSGYFYTDAYTTLCAWNGKLYFNDALHIYSYDPQTGTKTTEFTYSDGNGYLYGLQVRENRLKYRLNTDPNAAGVLLDSGIEPVIPPICRYDAETAAVFVNSAFAGNSALLCAGYDADGRLQYVCFLLPDTETMLPVGADRLRLFRLGGGYAPVQAVSELWENS